MKKTILILTVMMITGIQVMLAGNRTSILDITVFNNNKFAVKIDGERVGPVRAQQTIEGVTPGRHFIEIFAIEYSPNLPKGRRFKVFEGNVTIGPNRHIVAHINDIDRYIVLSNDPIFLEPVHDHYENWGQCVNHGHSSCNHSGVCGSQAPVGPVCGHNGCGMHVCHLRPMTEVEFASLRNVIRCKWYERVKVQMLSDAIGSNFFTALQVREMMTWLSFESSRVKIAKRAYPKTVNQGQFYIVYDALHFNHSVHQLSAYVASH